MEAVPFWSLVQEPGKVILKKIKSGVFCCKSLYTKKSQVFLCLFCFFPSTVLPGDAAGGHLEMNSTARGLGLLRTIFPSPLFFRIHLLIWCFFFLICFYFGGGGLVFCFILFCLFVFVIVNLYWSFSSTGHV